MDIYYYPFLEDEYLAAKEYLTAHSVNDSFPDYVDHMSDYSIICLVDDIVLECEFDDLRRKISIHQIFDLVMEDTEYGKIPELVPVDEDKYREIFNRIRGYIDES